jgi:hypothetical protein
MDVLHGETSEAREQLEGWITLNSKAAVHGKGPAMGSRLFRVSYVAR